MFGHFAAAQQSIDLGAIVGHQGGLYGHFHLDFSEGKTGLKALGVFGGFFLVVSMKGITTQDMRPREVVDEGLKILKHGCSWRLIHV